MEFSQFYLIEKYTNKNVTVWSFNCNFYSLCVYLNLCFFVRLILFLSDYNNEIPKRLQCDEVSSSNSIHIQICVSTKKSVRYLIQNNVFKKHKFKKLPLCFNQVNILKKIELVESNCHHGIFAFLFEYFMNILIWSVCFV